eukprot:TRINITY_DN59172_c0_g1_i1.p1 TRINITY_DN59172_c0_g1~~TRINITY_DN59172_c0_g1_i1.p1  ORF type:complete len:865 (-),score=190.90 TRINITY_DN59172_c0_g1_i1:593-3187(-)
MSRAQRLAALAAVAEEEEAELQAPPAAPPPQVLTTPAQRLSLGSKPSATQLPPPKASAAQLVSPRASLGSRASATQLLPPNASAAQLPSPRASLGSRASATQLPLPSAHAQTEKRRSRLSALSAIVDSEQKIEEGPMTKPNTVARPQASVLASAASAPATAAAVASTSVEAASLRVVIPAIDFQRLKVDGLLCEDIKQAVGQQVASAVGHSLQLPPLLFELEDGFCITCFMPSENAKTLKDILSRRLPAIREDLVLAILECNGIDLVVDARVTVSEITAEVVPSDSLPGQDRGATTTSWHQGYSEHLDPIESGLPAFRSRKRDSISGPGHLGMAVEVEAHEVHPASFKFPPKHPSRSQSSMYKPMDLQMAELADLQERLKQRAIAEEVRGVDKEAAAFLLELGGDPTAAMPESPDLPGLLRELHTDLSKTWQATTPKVVDLRNTTQIVQCPRVLVVTKAEKYGGRYDLVSERTAHGMPLWHKPDTKHWIFCGANGRWRIGGSVEEAREFKSDGGLVSSDGHHRGRMPEAMAKDAWLTFDGEHWLDATGLKFKAEGGYTSISVEVSKEAPHDSRAPSALIVSGSNGYDGRYDIVRGETANDMPMWKKKGMNLWLFSSKTGKWLVGGEDEEAADFEAGERGYVISRALHLGAMPQEVLAGGWQRFDGDLWLSLPRMVVQAETPEDLAKSLIEDEVSRMTNQIFEVMPPDIEATVFQRTLPSEVIDERDRAEGASTLADLQKLLGSLQEHRLEERRSAQQRWWEGQRASKETQNLIELADIRSTCEEKLGFKFRSWVATTYSVSKRVAGGTFLDYSVTVDISSGRGDLALLDVSLFKTPSGEVTQPVVKGVTHVRNNSMAALPASAG